MTLKVTSSSIEIRNSTGTTKFTSSNKLVYTRFSQTGTINVGSSRVIVPFQKLLTNDFLVLTIKLNSSTGSTAVINPTLGVEQPVNGPIVVDFYGRLGAYNQQAADTEFLHVMSVGSNLEFKTLRYNSAKAVVDGSTTNNLTYNARVYGYL